MYQHHQLHRSRLVLLLQQWAQASTSGRNAAHTGQDIAQQLSLWLSTVDAVQLSRALHALEVPALPVGPQLAASDLRALQASLDAAQSELTALVDARPPAPRHVRERADNTPVEPPDPEAVADFALYGARYLAVQKQIEGRLTGLREQVRRRLSTGGNDLRRLAAMDAVMEHMLGAREQRLWASLSGHLERRMQQRRAAHRQRLQDEGRDDEPHRWALPGGWLHAFEQDMRSLQRAELQVRLQPLVGLLDAAVHHSATTPRSALTPLASTRAAPTRLGAPHTTTTTAMTGKNE